MRKVRVTVGLISVAIMSLISCGKVGQTGDLHTLINQDIIGNRKSVYWDGKEASLVKDELDDLTLTDGRGWGIYSKVDILDNYEFSYFDNKNDYKTVSDDPANYILESEDQRIVVKEIDYYTEKEKLDTDENFRQTDKLKLKEDRLKLFEEYQTYTCILDNYAGYTIIFKSELNGKSYNITCVGKGILPNIELQAKEVTNSFRVYIDN